MTICVIGVLENGEQHLKAGIFTEAESKMFMEAAVKRGCAGLKYRHFIVVTSTPADDSILDVTP